MQLLQYSDELRLDSASPLTRRPRRSQSVPLRGRIAAEHHRQAQLGPPAAGLELLLPANFVHDVSKIHPGGLQEGPDLDDSLTTSSLMMRSRMKH